MASVMVSIEDQIPDFDELIIIEINGRKNLKRFQDSLPVN